MSHCIDDPIESGAGRVPGLGLLPTTVSFGAEKVLGRSHGRWGGHLVEAYEIHHGVAALDMADACRAEPFLDGCRSGSVWGTMWHGAFENDGFRRAWLTAVTGSGSRSFRVAEGAMGFGDRREAMIDRLADAVAENLDTAALLTLLGRN